MTSFLDSTVELENTNFPMPSKTKQANAQKEPKDISSKNVSCIDYATHRKNCPVCCKLYKSHDIIYIIVIILLVVLIGFLIKKAFKL